MDGSEKPNYRFEDVEIYVARSCLLLKGEEKHLRPKSFQVLLYLLEHCERLVSKNELMETIWENTAVTDDVLVQCVKEIRRTIGDDSHNPQFIKTFPKLGYRFISPVETFPIVINTYHTEEITRVELEYEEEFSDEAPISKDRFLLSKQSFFSPAFIFLTLISVLMVAFLSFAYLRQNGITADAETILPKINGKKSLAVMYFDNQTENKELEWLREGLTDMLITNFSRSSKLTILSRGQLHQLLERNNYEQGAEIESDKALDISRQAKAEIVLTGSYVKLGEKIRIDVQILDTKNGSLKATESLTVEKPEQILTAIDLLSLKLTKHLGVEEAVNQKNFADVMTDDLEAFRYYSIGIEKTQALHNQEAIELFEKAIALDKEFAMAHARIGYTYTVSWGYSEKGKPYLEKAFKLSKRLNEKDRLSITAWYAIANHDYLSAINTYRKIIEEYPLETESYWRLSRLLAGEEKSDEAVEVLKQGLIIDPNDRDINNTLGGIYSELGKHKEAIEARQRYVELAPTEANAYDSLGLAYQWSGDYISAIANYKRSLEINPKFEIALVHLANTRFQIGQYDEAENLLKRYIEIAPSESEKARGWDNLAQIYLKTRDLNSAEKAANEVLKYRKEMVWTSLATALEKGDSTKAKKFEEVIFAEAVANERGARLNKRFDYYYRGIIELKKGQNEAALSSFQEAVRRKPPIWNIDAYEDCLANAYLKLGRFDEAIAEYQRILQLNPNYPLVRFHLAQAFHGKGLNEKAKDSYKTFLEIWKNADSDIPEILTAKKFV